MASGKTCVGAGLSSFLHWPFVDLDVLVEEASGHTVAEFFDLYGEDEFRKKESAMLKSVIDGCCDGNLILSTGGGVVLDEKNRVMLKEKSFPVFLRASAETVMRRLDGKVSSRPLLKSAFTLQQVEDMISVRSPFYEATAGLIVDVDGLSVDEIVKIIISDF